MNCRRSREMLPLLDAASDKSFARLRGQVETHLAHCEACRAYQAEIGRLVGALNAAGQLRFTPEYLDSFTARVAVRAGKQRGSRHPVAAWWQRLEMRPLPTLSQAGAVVWVASIIMLEFPGVAPVLRQLLGL